MLDRRRLGPAAPALGRRDRRPPAVPRLGARRPPRGPRRRPAAGPRAGRRASPPTAWTPTSRRSRRPSPSSACTSIATARTSPTTRASRRSTLALAEAAASQPRPGAACSTRLVTELARQRRRRGRRVAHPLAAAHRPGHGQGRRGPGLLALRAAGVARRGRRRRRAGRDVGPRRRAPRAPRRRRRRGGRRRCWPAPPTTPSAPRTYGRPAWRSPQRPRRFVELVDEWFDGPGSHFAIDLAIQWLALQTVVTTPGLDGPRLAAFLVKAGAGGRRCTRRGPTPDEPYERQLGRLADVLAAVAAGRRAAARARRARVGRSAWRCSPSGSRRPASPTCTRARRRSGTCSSIPTTARRPTTTRWTRSSPAPPGSTGGWRGPSPARRPPGRSSSRRLLAVRRRSTSPATSRCAADERPRRLRPPRPSRRSGAGDDRAAGRRAPVRPGRRPAARDVAPRARSTACPTPRAARRRPTPLDRLPGDRPRPPLTRSGRSRAAPRGGRR